MSGSTALLVAIATAAFAGVTVAANLLPAGPGAGAGGTAAGSQKAGTAMTGRSLPAVVTHSVGADGYRWPLAPPGPRVVRRFSLGPQPWSPGHRGVDLAAAAGAPVLAAAAGTVSFAGDVAGRGVMVITHPDGVRTSYEPVVPAVRAGRQVRAAEPIATLATAGAHCAPTCLHWGARRGEVYLDPLTLLAGRGPPVLLPLTGAPGS